MDAMRYGTMVVACSQCRDEGAGAAASPANLILEATYHALSNCETYYLRQKAKKFRRGKNPNSA